jgi:hypothetical protein
MDLVRGSNAGGGKGERGEKQGQKPDLLSTEAARLKLSVLN